MSTSAQQIDYAIKRVRDIAQRKINALQWNESRIKEQVNNFLVELTSGKLKVIATHENLRSTYLPGVCLDQVFDMTKFRDNGAGGRDPDYHIKVAKITSERDRITDELTLGDSKEALAMIRAFEAF